MSILDMTRATDWTLFHPLRGHIWIYKISARIKDAPPWFESFALSSHFLLILYISTSGLKAHLVSLLPTEADTVLDREFVGRLAGAGQSGRVTAVSEAAQVSRHCRETRGRWKEWSVTHNLDAVCMLYKHFLYKYYFTIAGTSPWFVFSKTQDKLCCLNPHVSHGFLYVL